MMQMKQLLEIELKYIMSNSKMSNISKDNRQTGVEYRYNLDKTENPKYVAPMLNSDFIKAIRVG